jgi:hypothetical protein
MVGIGLRNGLKKADRRRSHNGRYTRLTIQNVRGLTRPLDVALLFWHAGFHPSDAEVQMRFPEEGDLAHANVTLPKREARAAQRWVNGQWWNGKKLYAKDEEEDGSHGGNSELNKTKNELKKSAFKGISPKKTSGRHRGAETHTESKCERNIAIHLIALIAHVEGISEEQKFVPPVAVNVTDQDGKVWDFEYSPEWESVDILHVAPKLPVSLRLTDAKGNAIETEITDLTLRPEWIRPFLRLSNPMVESKKKC